jgi:hypothetical protein
VAKDLLRLVSKATDLARALRKIAIGGLMAAAGLSATARGAEARQDFRPAQPAALGATIVDRSKKTAKLVLRLPSTAVSMYAQHRSHRSHSSHSSHRSSSGGSIPAPVVPRPAPIVTPPAAPPAVVSAAEAAPVVTGVVGDVSAVDKTKRTIVIKQSDGVERTFAYRDDTLYETAYGGSRRFDDFAESNAGRFPVRVGQKVEVKWRMSPDGKSQVATAVRVKP